MGEGSPATGEKAALDQKVFDNLYGEKVKLSTDFEDKKGEEYKKKLLCPLL